MRQTTAKEWTAPTVRDWLAQITFIELTGTAVFVDGRRVPADLLYLQSACPDGLHPGLSTDPALPVLAEWVRSEYGETVDQSSIAKLLTTLRARTGLTLDEVKDLRLADAVRAIGLKMPHGGWKASPPVQELDADKMPPMAERPIGEKDEHTASNIQDPPELVAWLKRVTPEWPPMGIDWPLVLCQAEHILSGTINAGQEDCEALQDGERVADYLRGGLATETIRSFDSFSRGYAYTSILLDAYGLLEALCTASLMLGYDLDAIERPVKQLPPFHGLLCLGMPVVEMIRVLRDLAKADIEAVTEAAAEPVSLGAAFGMNMHQAGWNLADEISHLSDSVSEGRLAVEGLADQAPGAMEDAWWRCRRHWCRGCQTPWK